jgi:ribonuclease HI
MSQIQAVADMYTDGSCHTQLRTGGWAAIIFITGEKVILTGINRDTTHNRMELTAVIKGIAYIKDHYKDISLINIYTDSQYVAGLEGRKEKLISRSLCTQNGTPVQNEDLVRELWAFGTFPTLDFIKVKAHQKQGSVINPNIEADKLVRKLVRKEVQKNTGD